MVIGDYNAGLAFHFSAGTIPIDKKDPQNGHGASRLLSLEM